MKVYRVYCPFHEPDESGTKEFGIFLDRNKAVEILKKIYKKERKENPEDRFAFKPKKGALHIYDGFDSWSYYIEEFEVDEKIERENIGYT
jgi:hypothetical protein